jgi:hypothetical protein
MVVKFRVAEYTAPCCVLNSAVFETIGNDHARINRYS